MRATRRCARSSPSPATSREGSDRHSRGGGWSRRRLASRIVLALRHDRDQHCPQEHERQHGEPGPERTEPETHAPLPPEAAATDLHGVATSRIRRVALLSPESPGDTFIVYGCWGPEIEWHERDVVVPAFRRWLEAQGWTTEAEKGYIDVVAHRGQRDHLRRGEGADEGAPRGRTGLTLRSAVEANACKGNRRLQHEVRSRRPYRLGSGRSSGSEPGARPSPD